MKVFKFGGASVKDANGIKNLSKIVKEYSDNSIIIIVVSAIGKTTNAFENLLSSYLKSMPDIMTAYQPIKDNHYNIVKELFISQHPIYKKLDKIFCEIESLLEKEPSMDRDYEYDKFISYGEILSSIIVYEWLLNDGVKLIWQDIRKSLKTDYTHREAKVDWTLSQELFKANFSNTKGIIITQGFIAGTPSNISTTLGREGSDYSAAIIAFLLNAESLTIWKDVPGILNADPRWFEKTEKIDEISYQEAIELAYYGAQVIHPKTIKPLENKKIPLYVKPFETPQEKGTLIHSINKDLIIPPIYIRKDNQVLISISPKDFSFIAEENISEIFAIIAKYRVKVNLIQNSAISFSIVTDNDESKIFYLIGELQNDFKVLYNQNLSLYTIRHYNQIAIDNVLNNKEILLHQQSRRTARFVVR